MRHSADSRPGFSPTALITLILAACLFLPACSLLPAKKPAQIAAVARPPESVARPPEPPAKPTPPPRPDLTLYRNGQIDPRANALSEKLQAAAFRNPAAGLKDLTAALVGQEKDPFMKIKLIHDWICVNISYDVAMLKSQFAADQDIEHVMNSRKAVCSGYSRVFQAMAEQAGFSCATVSGFTKNQAGPRGLTPGNSHAWNIVQISGGRYIVDTTFDAGHVKDWTFVRRYSTDNLFVDPQVSLYVRYPKQEDQQLVARPISPEEFLNSPDVENAFFSLGLRLPLAALSWKTAAAGDFSFAIGLAKPGIVIDAVLSDPNGSEIEQGTMIQRLSPDSRRILVRMPSAGLFTLELFAKDSEEKRPESPIPASKSESPLHKVLTFQLDNATASRQGRFPLFYAQYQNAPGDSLIEPLSGDLRSRGKHRFSYCSPAAAKAALLANDAFYPMEKGSDGVFRLEMEIPMADTIKLATTKNGKDYWVAVAWRIVE